MNKSAVTWFVCSDCAHHLWSFDQHECESCGTKICSACCRERDAKAFCRTCEQCEASAAALKAARSAFALPGETCED